MKLIASALAFSLVATLPAVGQTFVDPDPALTELIDLVDGSRMGKAAWLELGNTVFDIKSDRSVSFNFKQNSFQTDFNARAVKLYCKASTMALENQANPAGPDVEMKRHIDEMTIARVLQAGRNQMGFSSANCVSS